MGDLPPEADVVLNGARVEEIVLHGDTEAGAQLGGGHGADVTASDADGAAADGDLVEAHEQGQKCGLARAYSADDAQGTPLGEVEGDAAGVVHLAAVGEGDVLKGDVAVGVLGEGHDPLGSGLADVLPAGVQHLADTVHGGGALGEHHEDAGDGEEGVGEDGEVLDEGDDGAGMAGARVDTDSAHRHDRHQTHVQKEVDEGIGHRHIGGGGKAVLHEVTVHRLKAALLVVLAGESLDDADALCVLPHHPHHGVPRLLGAAVEGHTSLGDYEDGEHDEGHDREHDQGQHRIQRKSNDEAAHQQNGGADTQPLHHAHHVVDVVGIRGEAGLQGGHRKAVGLGAGEAHGGVKEIVTDGGGHVLGHVGRHAVGHDVEHQSRHGADRHDTAPDENGAQSPLGVPREGVVLDDLVEDHTQYVGQGQLDQRPRDLDGKSHRHPTHEGTEIGE